MSTFTRRAVLGYVALGGGALVAAGRCTAALARAVETRAAPELAPAPGSQPRAAVVAFFDGQLWLDTSGTSVPYQPPQGARGAAALASLTDEELRRAHLWL